MAHAYMINGRYVDGELFAETISNLFAQGWTLTPPSPSVALTVAERDEVAEARIPEGGWGTSLTERADLS